MTLKRRIEALEGSLRMDLDRCPACDPGPNTITITYKVNDLDPRTSPGEALAPHEVKQCPECGIITRVWVGDKEGEGSDVASRDFPLDGPSPPFYISSISRTMNASKRRTDHEGQRSDTDF